MIDTLLLVEIKRILACDMGASKKVKRIQSLIIRWTSASTSNDL
jgi:hypothetical protein|tara:strand:+ start:498 stop:629 length:132 start_codon:yes stop_codon:yes gene_type:complete